MLPFLPISISTTSSSLSRLAWPEEAERALKDLTLGPAVSHVDTGARLFTFICKLRDVLDFSSQPPLAFGASTGFSLFFDHYMSRDEAKVWFDEVVPGLGALSLRLPSLLEAHYCKSKELNGIANCELRILGSQDAGIVILNRIFTSGSIEDQSHDALEVVFSNESFGGNSLYMGCVQEQIRFMINPELVGGMLFMTSMDNNEAIEVVGVERYTQYTGEVNKAFVGFMGSKYESNNIDNLQESKTPPADGKTASTCKSASNEKANGAENQNEQGNGNENVLADDKAAITCNSISDENANEHEKQNGQENINGNENGSGNENVNANADVGIATGNWGCGVFGGNPQIKCMIQWIAASQGIEWILNKKWNVGNLWIKVVDYSSKKLEGKTTENFFSWLQSAESTNSVHARANGLSGSKRDPDRTRQDDRPNRVKRKPVWLSDYVTMMR
ncbi:Poly (ADP-ribose) glycohydrolase family protein [Rhynchospora pubera]|uniref:Poly (ADP-ribose) glycohydrolase family protein n=1 Tax=Rhynchospora pubera TaxID=906938 RepID=A0AAV8GYS1_9POAL|nr:Poly (ADP-ribose) glycohydrolase family protein [Rhynchospora pubera]